MAESGARRVLVVGAGVVGLCAALEAARRGQSVHVVDDSPDWGDGCSFGNSGLVVPSHVVPLAAPGMVALGLKWMWNPESPFYVRPRLDPDLLRWGFRFWRAATPQGVAKGAPVLRDLHLASRALFEDLERFFEGFTLHRRGLLMLAATEHGFDEEVKAAELARGLGIEARVLSASETAALEPALAVTIAGAVHFPLDAHLDPTQLMETLRKETARLGVTFEASARATGFRTRSGRVEAVVTTTGEREADAFVLAAGTWSTSLARTLGLDMPLLPGKGVSLTLPKPPRTPSIPSILTEARVAVTPIGHALRFGGTMELGALDRTIAPARVRGIVKSVGRYFPELGPEALEGIRPWAGLRPCSPDGLPYIGPFARFPNLIAATGHAMMGVSLGPITGRLVAEILSGEEPSLRIEALRPDRFV